MSLIRAIWDRYEGLMERLLKLQPLSPTSLLRVRTMVYHGEPLVAGDQRLLPGMRVLDLHLDNKHLASMGKNTAQVTFRLHERLLADLVPLHAALQAAEPPLDGVVGVSMLARGARSLGFHLAPMPRGLWRSWLQMYMRVLDWIYRPTGLEQRRKKAPRQVQLMWLTTAELGRLLDAQAQTPRKVAAGEAP